MVWHCTTFGLGLLGLYMSESLILPPTHHANLKSSNPPIHPAR